MTLQRRILLAAGGGWLFDAMDLLLVSSAVVGFAKAHDLVVKATVGPVLFWNLLGMFAGAASSGFLADRFGRKAVFQWSLLLYAVFTGISAFAPDAQWLAGIRFVAGLGLGAELPVASTLLAEFSKPEDRGRSVVLLESFWAYGSVLAALIGFAIVPLHEGWRIAFLIGVLPALYIAVIRRAIPESPRWLLAQGREIESSWIAQDASLRVAADNARRASIGELFGARFGKRTVTVWLLWIAMVFSYYGIFTWMPGLLATKGFTPQQSFALNLAIALFQIPGYYTAAYAVERFGRKPALVTFLACAAIGSFFFAGAVLAAEPSATAIVLWGGVIAFFNLAAWGVTYAYTPEQYPTSIRASGAGLAAGAGRFVGAFAPLMVGSMLTTFGTPYNVFIVFACVMLGGALVVLLLGDETRGKTLESLGEERLGANAPSAGVMSFEARR